MEEGLVLGGQPRPPSQGGVAPAFSSFGGSPLLMHTWLDLHCALTKTRTPVTFCHNFTNTALMSVILGIENLHLILN